jgi:acyl-CoA synthetase (AMP-forming)/AMP-acid ligase II/acyl carrier protein
MGDAHLRFVSDAAGVVGVIGPLQALSAPAPSWTLASLEADAPSGTPDIPIAPTDDAEILFTSGTTGVPKGVVATHHNLLYPHADVAPPQDTCVVLHAVPAATLAGQGLLLQPLDAVPHRLVVLPEYRDADFVTAIAEQRPTQVVLVPAMVLSLIHSHAATTLDSSSIELVRTMSAPIPPAALAQLAALFPHAAIINMYATTESWPARTRIHFNAERSASVGRPSGSASIRVVDDAGTLVPPGTQGHIELSVGDAPQRRYLDDPDATAEVFHADGWVRTGDLGYLDPDGFLYLLDRDRDLVISGGLNISTLEVEAAIHEYPDVIEAAVVGLPHVVLGEYLAAAVRVTPDFDRQQLYDFLHTRLGDAKAPKRVVVVEELPRTAVGKVLKRELRDDLRAKFAPAEMAPQDPPDLTRAIAEIWAEALELTGHLTPDADFLALGGTSLTAMEIVAAVADRLGRRITQRDVFEAETLEALAARVALAEPASVTRIQRADRSSPSSRP